MPVNADSVIVELEARTDAFRRQISQASSSFDADMAKIQAAGARAEASTSLFTGRVVPGLRAVGTEAVSMSRTAVPALEAVEAAEYGVAAGAAAANVAMAVITVAIGAVTAALYEAHAAGQFAEDLVNQANAAHLTTDQLQVYQYALRSAGGDADRAAGALHNLSVIIGQAERGTRGAVQAFHALGFTPDEVRAWRDTQDALDHIIPRINELRDSSQRDAIIQQLGLRDLSPLIEDFGRDASAAFRAADESARQTGQVMDTELLARTATMNSRIDDLTHKVGNELTAAFSRLTPILYALLVPLERALAVVNRMLDRMAAIPDRSTAMLQSQADQIRGQIAQREATGSRAIIDTEVPHLQQRLDALERELGTRRSAATLHQGILDILDTPIPGRPVRNLLPNERTAHSPATPRGPNIALQGARAEDRTLADIYEAQRREAQARLALLQPLETEQQLQDAIVQATRAHRDAELAQQVHLNELTKGAQGLSQAQAARVTAANGLADAAEDELRHQQQATALGEQDLELDRRYFQSKSALLEAQLALAQTAAERVVLQRQILQAEHDLDVEDRRQRHATDRRYQGDDGRALAAREDTEADARYQARLRDSVQPLLDQWRQGILGAFDALRTGGARGVLEYLADRFKERLLDGLADQLSHLLLSYSPQSVGGGGGGGIGSIIAQGANYLFGGKRAFGGAVVAGESYLINEGRPEVFRPSVSGFMQPTGSMAGGGANVTQHFHFDNRGAFVAEQVFARQEALIRASEARAKAFAARGDMAVIKATPGIVGKYQGDRGR